MAFVAVMVIWGMVRFIRFLAEETPSEDWGVGVAVAILIICFLTRFLILWFIHRTLPRFIRDWNRLKEEKKSRLRKKKKGGQDLYGT